EPRQTGWTSETVVWLIMTSLTRTPNDVRSAARHGRSRAVAANQRPTASRSPAYASGVAGSGDATPGDVASGDAAADDGAAAVRAGRTAVMGDGRPLGGRAAPRGSGGGAGARAILPRPGPSSARHRPRRAPPGIPWATTSTTTTEDP